MQQTGSPIQLYVFSGPTLETWIEAAARDQAKISARCPMSGA